MTKFSNIYTVKQFEVEELPVYKDGKYVSEYSSAVGFGMSTSIKKAMEMAKEMLWDTQNGGCGIIGNMVILKGNVDITAEVFKFYNPYDKWSENDQAMFSKFLDKHYEEVELERLIKLESAA